MNPAKIFSLLTTRVPNNEGVGGGIPDMTVEDAVHYCQGMPRHHFYAGMVYWADDESSIHNLMEYAKWVGWKTMEREKWRIEKKYINGKELNPKYRPNIVRKLTELACAELLEPTKLKHNRQLKALWLDVSLHAWDKTWSKRYESIHSELIEWTNDAWRYLQKQQAKDKVG